MTEDAFAQNRPWIARTVLSEPAFDSEHAKWTGAPFARNGGLPLARIEELEAYLRTLYSQFNHDAGAWLAVAHRGKLVLATATGRHFIADGRPYTPGNRLRIGSVSKMVTAAAILDLVDRGMLSLDDHLVGPGSIFGNEFGWRADRQFTTWERGIRVRHLLTNTSGFEVEPDWHPHTQNTQPAPWCCPLEPGGFDNCSRGNGFGVRISAAARR